jgi:hypothetical protein
MERKILGILMSAIGLTCLILSVYFMDSAESHVGERLLLGVGLLGTIGFFAGLRVMPGGKAAK